jgi:Fe2+ or Zn2+ uptake regulation protein
MTKREMFNAIKAVSEVAENEEMVAFIDHEIELLSRKRSGSGKPTKNQEKNVEIKNVIVQILTSAEGGMTATELLNVLKADYPQFEVESNQKVSSLTKQLVDEGVITRVKGDKKKSLFTVVTE